MLSPVDTFYDPVEDGQGDGEHKELSPEEQRLREEEWKQELTKVLFLVDLTVFSFSFFIKN